MSNVSPGFVHLGFMIQRCCEDGIRYFDFLASTGGKGDYRRHFGGATSVLGTVHLVRDRRLALPYRSLDWFRRVRGGLRDSAGQPD
jgi:CelD/BcsL family acetyltransferase involved in cellulose biosynthesis